MRALDVACESCGAGPGDFCKPSLSKDRVAKSGVHETRKRRAHYITLGERKERNASNKAADAARKAMKQ